MCIAVDTSEASVQQEVLPEQETFSATLSPRNDLNAPPKRFLIMLWWQRFSHATLTCLSVCVCLFFNE